MNVFWWDGDLVTWCRWLKLMQISLKSYSTSLKQLDSNIRVVLGSELYPLLCLKTLYVCCCFTPKGSCSRFSVCSVSPSHGCFIRSWRKLVFTALPGVVVPETKADTHISILQSVFKPHVRYKRQPSRQVQSELQLCRSLFYIYMLKIWR